MFKSKLYLYDSTQEANGYRGTDLSSYILQGTNVTEDISQELDTYELTLMGYPTQNEFAPETKMILDIVEQPIEEDEEGDETIVYTYHLMVNIDTVEKPILSDDNYYKHSISFLEPSVVAQKRLVDNISATYKLKDVNLETAVGYPLAQEAENINTPSAFIGNKNWTPLYYGKYFDFEGTIQMLNSQDNTDDYYYKNIENFEVGIGTGIYKARFSIPKLAIYFGTQNTTGFSKIGYASIDWVVQEFNEINLDTPTDTWSGTIHSNSTFSSAKDYAFVFSSSLTSDITNYWLPENYIGSLAGVTDTRQIGIKQYSQSGVAPSYFTDEIEIRPQKIYKVSVTLHNYSNNVPTTTHNRFSLYNATPNRISTVKQSRVGLVINFNVPPSPFDVGNQLTFTNQFFVYESNETSLILQSSVPYSALTLVQKAILNSSLYEKAENVCITDINNSLSTTPFYIDNKFVTELSTTQVIENFYNQKNLWEILLEVGYYIHAVPEIRFGDDDKFMITFNRLGRTDQKIDYGTKQTILNFNTVEDYVSACSSYITNMVQLGGYIDEWVAPKNDETWLVYNDNAQIITTKPIIELLKIEVKCNDLAAYNIAPENAVKDMTEFVFEENVYKLLSLNYGDKPNRGYSLYYKLGDNKIIGGDYRLPTVNSGSLQNDYAIKKAIYSAYFGYIETGGAGSLGGSAWNNIKVNDFTFHIIYRTKDSVRQNQARPDLRKYLLSSKYDRVPEHNQFNNQTDVLVDSVKFGNNVYGKLIRTGNSQYRMAEWNDSLGAIKHKGELYSINNELYYVSKASHNFFSNHIESEVNYSKDYNQLSQVVGIPSEPRFYEISEQSSIKREVAINDYVLMTDDTSLISDNAIPHYLKTFFHLGQILFGGASGDFAKFVITVFKGDKNAPELNNSVGESNFYQEILSPINAYSSENTLTYEWDMADNFSAGDKVLTTMENDASVTSPFQSDKAYRVERAVQYTDKFGKSALMDFVLLDDIPDLTQEQIMSLPENPLIIRDLQWGTEGYAGTIRGLQKLSEDATTNTGTYALTTYAQLPVGGTCYLYAQHTTDIHDLSFYVQSYDSVNQYYIVTAPLGGELDNQATSGSYSGMYYAKVLASNISAKNTDPYNYLRCPGIPDPSYTTYTTTDEYVGDYVLAERHMIQVTAENKDQLGIIPSQTRAYTTIYFNGFGLSLLKDCREVISANYNLQMLTNSDTFVLSPFLFQPNKQNVKLVLLTEEVNKLSFGYIDNSTIFKAFNTSDVQMGKYFDLQMVLYGYEMYIDISTILASVNQNHFGARNENNANYQQIKAYAVVYDVFDDDAVNTDNAIFTPSKTKFIFARNLPDAWLKSRCIQDVYLGIPNKNLFPHKQ